MSKILTFNDGSNIEIMESSTIYDVIMAFTDPIEMINVWNLFTRDNLSHGYIGNEEFYDIIPLDLDLIKDDNGLIIARFESRDKTKMELVKEEIDRCFFGY